MTIIQTSTPGPQGVPGNTVLSTTGAPSNTIGINGDFANDIANQVMYGPKANGVWPVGVSYKGSNGASGSTILTTSGAPSNSVGNNGDFANDPVACVMYGPKSGGIWPAGNSYKSANSKWTTGTSYTGLVATRCKAPTAGGFTPKSHMARTIHTARSAITQIGAAFANWYCSGTAELPGGGPCTITASVEYPLGGTITRLTFGGSNTGTANDFCTLASDLVTLAIPAGAQFAIREYRIYAGAGAVCFTGFTGNSSIGPDSAAGDCYVYTGAVDLTGSSGSFASTDSVSYAPPVAVFGPTTAPCYALIGDSRVEGYQDTPNGNLYVGELARAVGPLRAFTNLAKYGESVSTVAGTGFAQRAAIAAKYCSHIICNYGVNDLFSGTSAPQLLKYLTGLRQQFPAQWFYQTTIDPETTSTDSWATTTNQTTVNSGDETAREQVNNFLRSGIGCFDGVFDTSSVVESGLNTGKWKAPGYTADGVHGNATSYGLIASSGVIQVA